MTTLRVKPGVQPPNLWIAAAVTQVAHDMGLESVTITSGLDGTHRGDSKHYQLAALDIRRYDMDDAEGFSANLQAQLGDNYDVVLEATHIHCEYDPA